MSKTIFLSMLLAGGALLGAWSFFGFSPEGALPPTVSGPPTVNARLAETGPYAERLRLRQKLGDKIVEAQASRLSVKKAKVFVFESALLARPVAEDLRVTVHRGEDKLLELTKDKAPLGRDLTSGLSVQAPRILFPEHLRADRVTIEPDGAIMLEVNGVRERLPGS